MPCRFTGRGRDQGRGGAQRTAAIARPGLPSTIGREAWWPWLCANNGGLWEVRTVSQSLEARPSRTGQHVNSAVHVDALADG